MYLLGVLGRPLHVTRLVTVEADKVESHCTAGVGRLFAILFFGVEHAAIGLGVDLEDMGAHIASELAGLDRRLGSAWHMALNAANIALAMNVLGIAGGLISMTFGAFLLR